MRARLVRLFWLTVDLLAYELAVLIGVDYKRWKYARRHVRRQAGYKAGETRRLNKELAKVNAGASLQFPTIDADDTELCA